MARWRPLADLGFHGTEAVIVSGAATALLEGLAGRARPYVAAAAVMSESQRWWPGGIWLVAPAMYGGATLVGPSRMYNNAHWASDVVLRAASGTFSGIKVVRYSHGHTDNAVDRFFLGPCVGAAPGGGTAVGWSTAW